VSLRRCEHLGRQLGYAVTCGALCSAFPRCLPPLPPLLVREIATFTTTTDDDPAHVADILAELHNAIIEGLKRKGLES
jgi:hypothetical protein